VKIKRNLKKWPLLLAFFIIFLSLPATLLGRSFMEGEGGGWQIHAEEPVVRLHVRASGDSPAEQRFKMAVASQVQRLLSAMRPPEVNSCEAYLEFLQGCLPGLEQDLREWAATEAGEASIEVRLAEEMFPLRTYGRHVYPAGKYTALTVTIGEGAGENWWCLLFPSLCLPPATAADEEISGREPKAFSQPSGTGLDGALYFSAPPASEGRRQPAAPSRWRFRLWELIWQPGRHFMSTASENVTLKMLEMD